MSLFECVPNFSEGRDRAKVDAIAAAARTVPGVALLDVEMNADHHRSVLSLAGEGEPLLEAVFRMAATAIPLIDLNQHHGEHPRMGAVDVVPFVPLGDSTTEQAVGLAGRLAERIWNELHVPVYLYGLAARRPERSDLSVVRKGEFEGLREAASVDPTRAPDIGGPNLHPTAGAVAVGARPVLIAYNAYLSTPDVQIAKKVARAVRGRDGGLAEVKALGFEIRERNRAQVSMNLTDYRRTPVHRALEEVRREAARYGAEVEESEVVGLIPEDALFDAAEYYLQLHHFDRSTILERKVRGVSASPPPTAARLADLSLNEFAQRLAARTPTPGGGSAAAAAGALGAALGEMVVAYAQPKDAADATLAELALALGSTRTRFVQLVDEDAASFERVRAARKAAKGAAPAVGAAGVVEALRGAAAVPLETAHLAVRAIGLLKDFEPRLKEALRSDFRAARALLEAAREGAVENVRANLIDLRTAGADVGPIEADLRALEPVH